MYCINISNPNQQLRVQVYYYRKDGIRAAPKVAWSWDALRALNLIQASGIGTNGLLTGVGSSNGQGEEDGADELHFCVMVRL